MRIRIRVTLFVATILAGAVSPAEAQGKLNGVEALIVLEKQGGTRLLGIIPNNEYLQKDLKITASQLKRMREILLQLTRPSRLFLRKDLIEKIGISDEQRKHARDLRTDFRKKYAALMKTYMKQRAQKKEPDIDLLQKRRGDMEKKTEVAIFRLLTVKQRERLKRLEGTRIDRKKLLVPTYRITKSVLLGEVNDNKALQQELKISPAQLKRMREIEVQLKGPRHLFQERDLRKRLGITAQQRKDKSQLVRTSLKQALALTAEYQELKAKKGFNDADFAAHERNRKKLFVKREQALLKLLTPSQRRQLKEFMGKPLDLNQLRRAKNATRKRPDV